MGLTSVATVATGDTITALTQNTMRDNDLVLDARTGGDPAAAGKLLRSSGALAGSWLAPGAAGLPLVSTGATVAYAALTAAGLGPGAGSNGQVLAMIAGVLGWLSQSSIAAGSATTATSATTAGSATSATTAATATNALALGGLAPASYARHATGTYAGDGITPRAVPTGTVPKLVAVTWQGGPAGFTHGTLLIVSLTAGLAILTSHDSGGSGAHVDTDGSARLDPSNGFIVGGSSGGGLSNASGVTYNYAAIG